MLNPGRICLGQAELCQVFVLRAGSLTRNFATGVLFGIVDGLWSSSVPRTCSGYEALLGDAGAVHDADIFAKESGRR